MARPEGVSGVTERASLTDVIVPKCATRCILSPSTRWMIASTAPHSRAALSATASSTGWTSVGEREMTRRISLVAVCCSRASFVSLNNRTFSMAMTAWSAKVLSSSTSASENTPAVRLVTRRAPTASPPDSIGTATQLRNPSTCPACRTCVVSEGSSMSGI